MKFKREQWWGVRESAIKTMQEVLKGVAKKSMFSSKRFKLNFEAILEYELDSNSW